MIRRTGGELVDRTEYERIATEYLDMVYKIALNYTGKPMDADDVVQQTFYKLLARKKEFSDEEHIKRWLIRVCINECNSLFSGFWRRNVRFFSERAYEEASGKRDAMTEEIRGSEGFISGAEDPVFAAMERRALYEAMQTLSAGCRIVTYLFYYEGYKTKEIAQLLHMREATVRTRLVRGRKMLKEELKEAWDYE